MVIPERPATSADAVQGVAPQLVFEPSSQDEAVAVLARSQADGLALVFVGGGTDLGLGGPPARLDAVLRTSGLSRLVEHAPADQVVTAEAGMTLAALAGHLAGHKQRLALDAPFPDRATVGGVIAANAFGPRRARFGAVRDLLLGVTLVRADGTAARGGARVVKNVAGFDLPRLLVGSLGTLALITSATFRLHPLPETEATVLLAGLEPAQVSALASAWRAAQLEPTSAAALTQANRMDRTDLGVRFEGFQAGVADQVTRLLALAAPFALAATRLSPAEASAFWSRHDAVRERGALRLKLSAPPSRLSELARAGLLPLLSRLASPAAALYPTLGFAFLSGDPAPGADGAAAAELLSSLRQVRAAAVAAGGSLVLCTAPKGLETALDPWGAAPAAIDLMRSLKARFDPDRRLAPSRFVGGI
jgi:glycolate oxidase FAD binding subunit